MTSSGPDDWNCKVSTTNTFFSPFFLPFAVKNVWWKFRLGNECAASPHLNPANGSFHKQEVWERPCVEKTM